MTPLRTTLPLLLLTATVVLAAGCFGGDCIREQDIEIYKITGDGNTVWTKTIDSGRDDIVTDILQAPDGSYLVAGGQSDALCNKWSHTQTTPVLIWISDSGEVLRTKTYDGSVPDGFIAIDPGSDGGYQVTTLNGSIWTLDQSGTVITVTIPNQASPVSPPKTGPKSLVRCNESPSCTETGNGGYVIVDRIEETRVNKEDRWIRYQAERISANGSYAWRTDIVSKKAGVGKYGMKTIIPTRDGGFLLVFENEKRMKC